MPHNQLIQARVNGEIKAQATAALAAVGLTVSDAVRILLIRIAKEKGLPPCLVTPNATTLASLKGSEKDSLPRFDSIEACGAQSREGSPRRTKKNHDR